MFTKENIIIQNDTLRFLNPKCDMTNYEKNTNDLYDFVTKIIEELHIKSLLKITVKDADLFEKEGGRAVFTINNNIISSEIEISRKTYIQFNNENNIELKNEALAIIYHELYHVYDRENLYNKFKDIHISPEELKYYKIGVQYWSEFFAYYKTKKLYMSEYPIQYFNSQYTKSELSKEENFNNLLYVISVICAYMPDEKYLKDLENTTYYYYCKNNKNLIEIKNKLDSIISNYPENITTIDIFIELGKLFYKLF